MHPPQLLSILGSIHSAAHRLRFSISVTACEGMALGDSAWEPHAAFFDSPDTVGEQIRQRAPPLDGH
jgi:hypothetical protein